MARPKVRGPLWPSDADGAVVLYVPPEMSASDKLDPEKKSVVNPALSH